MLERFKEWYYKYGLFACFSTKEIEAALKTMADYNLKEIPENNFMYKLIYKLFFKGNLFEGFCKKVYVFRAKNRTQMFEAANNFIKLTDGFILKENVNRPMSIEES